MDFENDFHHRYIDYKKAVKDIDKLSAQFPRFTEVLHGIHAFLEISAHRGKLIKSPLYLYKTGKQYDVPSFKVYYAFNEKSVYIFKIRKSEEDDLLN